MISVIIPVFNVEPYVRRCLNSVVNQTYHDLEIIIVDDGSTDESGAICDEYKIDERVKVFHTENRGLSAARNLGLDEAKGEYIAFVDSDDWIEPWYMERSLGCIGDADIFCDCKYEGSYTGLEALGLLIKGKFVSNAWGKLYKTQCFSVVRFPDGRVFEDIATTYKVLYNSTFISFCDIGGYKYCRREGSITGIHDDKNLLDNWISAKEQFDFCLPLLIEFSEIERESLYINLLKSLAYPITRAWGWRYANNLEYSPEWENMSKYARSMFPYNVRRNFSLRNRLGLLFARFNSPFSFWLAYKVHMLVKRNERLYLFLKKK